MTTHLECFEDFINKIDKVDYWNLGYDDYYRGRGYNPPKGEKERDDYVGGYMEAQDKFRTDDCKPNCSKCFD